MWRSVNARFVITPVSISTLDWQSELRAGQMPLAAIGWQEDLHDPHNWYRPYLLDTYTTQFNLPDDLAQKYQALIDQGVSDAGYGGARASDLCRVEYRAARRCRVDLVAVCAAVAAMNRSTSRAGSTA